MVHIKAIKTTPFDPTLRAGGTLFADLVLAVLGGDDPGFRGTIPLSLALSLSLSLSLSLPLSPPLSLSLAIYLSMHLCLTAHSPRAEIDR